MDIKGRDLDFWKEAIEKVIIIEAKTLLQSSSSTYKIDSRYLRENRPAKKKKKDSEKTKFTDFPFVDALSEKSTHQSQTNKKD